MRSSSSTSIPSSLLLSSRARRMLGWKLVSRLGLRFGGLGARGLWICGGRRRREGRRSFVGWWMMERVVIWRRGWCELASNAQETHLWFICLVFAVVSVWLVVASSCVSSVFLA